MSNATEKKVVDWYIGKRKLVKFTDNDTPFKVADNVVPYFKDAVAGVKEGIKTGDKVEVSITIGSNEATVTFIKLEVAEKVVEVAPVPQDELKIEKAIDIPKTEEKPVEAKSDASIPVGEEHTWVVAGKALQQKPYAVVFDESPKRANGKSIFHTLPENLEAIFNTIKKGDKVKFTSQVIDGKNIITSLVKVEEARPVEKSVETPVVQKEAPVSSEQKSTDTWEVKQLKNKIRYLEDNKQESIEAQAATNSANLFAAGYFNNKTAIKVDIQEFITYVAKLNYETIQSLKNKEA
jgi:hypothetical protein